MAVGRRKDTVIGICSNEDLAVIYTTDRFYISLFERLQKKHPKKIKTVRESIVNGEVSEMTYEMQKTEIRFFPGSMKSLDEDRKRGPEGRYRDTFLQEVQEAGKQGFIGPLEAGEYDDDDMMHEEIPKAENP